MDLAERVKQLEQQVQALSTLVAGAVLGGPDQTLQAKCFELVDHDGKIQAKLGPTPEGPALVVGVGPDAPLAILVADTDGARLMLARAGHRPGVALMLDDVGTAQFLVTGADGKQGVSFAALANGPAMNFYDAQGIPRINASIVADGSPTIGLYDAERTLRGMFSANVNGTTSLDLFDPEGHIRARTLVDETGDAMLYLREPDSKQSTVLSFGGKLHGLHFHDADGNARLWAGLDPNGVPSVLLGNSEQQGRVLLKSDDVQNGLTIYDSGQRGRMLFGVDADEKPWLAISDGNDAQRVKLTLLPDGSPTLSLCDPDSRPLVTLSTAFHCPGLIVSDTTGSSRIILTGGMRPMLVVLDEAGQVEATFPPPVADGPEGPD